MKELTQREEEICLLVAEGLMNKEIAKRLGVSIHTVRNILAGAFSKLEIENRVQLVKWLVINKGLWKDERFLHSAH